MSDDPVERTRPRRRWGLTNTLELVLNAAAPITVLTALLVHVGSVRNRAYFGYFGIDLSVLRPSIQDYVLRSVDVTFGAVARLVAAAVVVIVLDRLVVRAVVGHRDTGYGRPHAVLLVVGATLGAVGLLFALGLAGWLGLPALVAAILLAAGSGVVLRLHSAPFTARGARRLGLPMTTALYATLVIALFWAVTLYAQDLGRRTASAVDADPARLPLVTVFSERYLDLPGSMVNPTRAPGAAETSHYRYTGLSLLTYSNDTWFLISGRYSDDFRSSVVLLRDVDTVRVEVASAR